MDTSSKDTGTRGLKKHLHPASVWALSIGTAIGWGSFVITGNTYLKSAGPLGSILGLIVGAVVMMIAALNYNFLMNLYPDAGGAYTYSKVNFGFDYGFLVAWFLGLTYISIFWANVTSLPLFARYFVGDIFKFGFHYSIFGYDTYLGEILLSITAVILTGFFCARAKDLISGLITLLSIIFTVGIVAVGITAIFRNGGGSYEPLLIPDKKAVSQVIRIACISPWAFIGFENISNFAEEFDFPLKKAFPVLAVSIISTTLLYCLIFLLSITAYPGKFRSWLDYINNLDKLEGLEGLPAFYAANRYMGRAGVLILTVTLFCVVLTSLIGNMLALSRLLYSLARDDVMPGFFSALNKAENPGNAILLIVIVSAFIPFLGRTAIGWIVDVTTLGAAIIYGSVSGAAFIEAKRDKKPLCVFTGFLGLLIMIFFAVMLLLPNIFSTGSMASESYFLFAIWAIAGMVCFRAVLLNDKKSRRFGSSGVVWIVLLLLILLTSLEWMRESTYKAAEGSLNRIIDNYGIEVTDPETGRITDDFILGELENMRGMTTGSSAVIVILFSFSVWIIINNHSLMTVRARERERELGEAKIAAYTDPLTGVKSKAAYSEAEAGLNDAIKAGTAEGFSVVVCDLNDLKLVNDTMGHKMGDELILSASRLICELFKHSPVYRVGGDEFTVILTGVDFENREEILKSLNDRVEKNHDSFGPVIAAGLSDYIPGEDKAFHQVFERADAYMYIRKKELKGQS